jgi:hypothetical protein
MSRTVSTLKRAGFVAALLIGAAATVSAQTPNGSVTMSATVSKFVEIQSGGSVTLSGNSGGGVNTDGTAGAALGVNIFLGELGPSNASSFVTATVPLRLKSNANYVLSMSATVSSTGTTTNKIVASDVGFGLGTATRSGVGVAAGTDTPGTSGDPTLAANGSVNAATGRYAFTATKSHLGAFATSATVLNGPYIMNAVPRTNGNGLNVPAIFAIKPQFFENGSTTINVSFTITAP